MKKLFYLFSLAFCSITFYSCEENGGEPLVLTYDLASFDRIELATSSEIQIIKSSTFRVIVDGLERDVHDTDVKVNGDKLSIVEHGHIDHNQLITIYVPEISELHASGSSNIFGETPFIQNQDMEIQLTGSGQIAFPIDIPHLNVELTGSGKIYLDGFADTADMNNTGSGWIHSFDLETQVLSVETLGSGSCEVLALDQLDVVITGSGNVYYKGHPAINVSVTGSGNVFDSN